jgi:hypothetical protein
LRPRCTGSACRKAGKHERRVNGSALPPTPTRLRKPPRRLVVSQFGWISAVRPSRRPLRGLVSSDLPWQHRSSQCLATSTPTNIDPDNRLVAHLRPRHNHQTACTRPLGRHAGLRCGRKPSLSCACHTVTPAGPRFRRSQDQSMGRTARRRRHLAEGGQTMQSMDTSISNDFRGPCSWIPGSRATPAPWNDNVPVQTATLPKILAERALRNEPVVNRIHPEPLWRGRR